MALGPDALLLDHRKAPLLLLTGIWLGALLAASAPRHRDLHLAAGITLALPACGALFGTLLQGGQVLWVFVHLALTLATVVLLWLGLRARVDEAGPSGPQVRDEEAVSLDKVMENEHALIRARRATLWPPTTTMAPPRADESSAKLATWGLCLSGGGVRSSSVGLGALQALQGMGLLRFIDYLSTVSGGGWAAAAWLSRWTSASAPPFARPGAPRTTESCPQHLHELTRRVDYLRAGGFWSGVDMTVALFRGPVCHGLMFPVPLALCIGLGVAEALCRVGTTETGDGIQLFYKTLTVLLLLGIALLVVGTVSLGRDQSWTSPSDLRILARHVFAGVGLILATPCVIAILALGLEDRSLLSLVPLLGSAATMLGGLYSMVGRSSIKVSSRMTRRLASAILGMTVIGLPLLGAVLVARLSLDLQDHGRWTLLFAAHSGIAIAGMLHVMYPINPASLGTWFSRRVALAFLAGGPDGNPLPDQDPPPAHWPVHLVSTTISTLPNDPRVPIPRDAPEPLIEGQPFTIGPSHVGPMLDPQGSPYAHRGWLPASTFLAANALRPLERRVGLSGAVLAPMMGRYTPGPVRALFTLFNLRMGRWVWMNGTAGRGSPPDPSPAALFLWKEAFGQTLSTEPWQYLSDGGHFENLGAFDLLARRCDLIIVIDAEYDPQRSFEALTRLQHLAFQQLNTRVEIELEGLKCDETGLSRRTAAVGTVFYPPEGENGEAAQRTGTFVYIKSSLDGTEAPFIRSYRTRNPEFPHLATSQQDFRPEDFEAYRNLGYRITREALRGPSEVEDRLRQEDAHQARAAWSEHLHRSEGARLEQMAHPRPSTDDLTRLRQEVARFDGPELTPDRARARLRVLERLVAAWDLTRTRTRQASEHRSLHATVRGWLEGALLREEYGSHGARYSSTLRRYLERAHGLRFALDLRREAAASIRFRLEGAGIPGPWQDIGRVVPSDGDLTITPPDAIPAHLVWPCCEEWLRQAREAGRTWADTRRELLLSFGARSSNERLLAHAETSWRLGT